MPLIEKYGMGWPEGSSDLWIELSCIKQGGSWKSKAGVQCGSGLFHHYKAFAKIVWPGDWWSRWDDAILAETIHPGTISIAGPASSSKTHRVACTGLTTYFAFPNQTTILCSTTTMDMLEMRIWGEIKKYYRQALEVDPSLPGHFIESKQMITTDGREVEGREFRNGIKGVACQKSGKWQGLGAYIGIKNERVMLIGDEFQLMHQSLLDAAGNLASNPWSLICALGNPNDTTNPFGMISEPKDGWESIQQGEKTQLWKTRFHNGRCLNLVGTDSPNLDFPEGQEPYRKLIGRRYIKQIAETYGKESWQYQSWVLAVFPTGALERRVITRALCLKFHAFEEANWGSGKIVKIFALDAAYGSVGGDRCVGGELWFGQDVHGRHQLAFQGKPILIPVDNRKAQLPEDQIATFVKDYCEARGIPPENVIYDSTGRGTLGSAFARVWSPAVVPLEFGGSPTERLVRDGSKQTCKQAYGKFVTELWFSWRLVIESDQFRGLPEEIMIEGQMRAWSQTGTNKVDVEPKADTKERLGRSPDYADMLVAAIEGARRKGFRIATLSNASHQKKQTDWLVDLRKRYKDLSKSKQLTYN